NDAGAARSSPVVVEGRATSDDAGVASRLGYRRALGAKTRYKQNVPTTRVRSTSSMDDSTTWVTQFIARGFVDRTFGGPGTVALRANASSGRCGRRNCHQAGIAEFRRDAPSAALGKRHGRIVQCRRG